MKNELRRVINARTRNQVLEIVELAERVGNAGERLERTQRAGSDMVPEYTNSLAEAQRFLLTAHEALNNAARVLRGDAPQFSILNSKGRAVRVTIPGREA